MEPGYHRVSITQVAEVGLQPAYNAGDEPRESLCVVFENAAGRQIAKVMALVYKNCSTLFQLLTAADSPDELQDLLGRQIVIEIEPNGKWPKIRGYSLIEDGLSSEPAIQSTAELLYYSVDEPNPETLKRLHPELKRAIAGRIRVKEV